MNKIDKSVRQLLMKEFNANRVISKKIRFVLKIFLWELTVFFALALKRSLDIFLSSIAGILLSPIFILTAVAIYIENPGPIFFTQTRVGKNGQNFDFYKFRSMVVNAESLKQSLLNKNESKDGVIFKMKRDPRITLVGRFIRKFSIDELPQLLNVIKGDMSLVGPRPPVPKEFAEYTLQDRKRLDVKPGITCIWQVSGRSNISFKQQVNLDVQYIKSHSIRKDLQLLFKTIPAVLTGKGAY